MFSGFAIYFNGIAVRTVGDPLAFTTLKNLGVGMILAVLVGIKIFRNRSLLITLAPRDWLRLLLIGVIGGSLPFYLFFKGLSITPAASGAIIHKTLIFWVALWAIPFLHEKLTIRQVLALGLVFGSSFIVGGITSLSFGTGEMMILAATILWAVENIIAKVALRKVDADVVVGARMIFGSLLLFAATIFTGKMSLISQLTPSQWGLTLTSIAFLTGYVMSWYRALREAPATLVATVLTLGAVITNVLSAVFITRAFKIELVLQTILLGAGVWLFWTASKKIPNYTLNVKSEHI
ncbi:MAG: hypothetical protein A3A65_01140 [Candidatus Chisholmbacteria bacterium RIFCSPLOWO2_01_FULL_49_14]|uniref:EamA domain-containing protein n=1 Tax=Candidatus Chisholmbacteria bacterium RIFCSPLOWO2_01_FULL_49_14 TaxID=1797593 RepID=A0A1G1VZE9_9BACT|nr:MAG: hypothetical protein A3A65_01140 [Candidatus Chisholmbacteria bacterium RIFCSPLOWO2_01_FULL_49_14]